VQPVKHERLANANKKLVGAPSYELWTFKATDAAFIVPQAFKIKFVYARPWEVSQDIKPLVFDVTTQQK